MSTWLVQRIASSLLTVFLLVSAVFFVVRLVPGDPVDLVADAQTSAVDRELLRTRFGLDGGIGEQYVRWLGEVVRGDFGTSLRQQRSVRDILAEAIPATLWLTVAAYALHLVLAFGTALLAASGRSRRWSSALQSIGLVFYSVPAFWLGLMLILLLSGKAGWFPAAGMEAPDAAFLPPLQRILDRLWHLALPAIALGLSSFMGTARYLQSALEEAMEQDYILAARARGIPERVLLMKHALRNALLPVITILGLHLPLLLGGAVVIETVFAWPGLGRISVEAIFARDYPVIMATSLLAAVAVTFGSLLADIGYRWADPRVRLSESDSP